MTSMMMCSVAISMPSLQADVSALSGDGGASCRRLGLKSAVHLDITSLPVDGAYAVPMGIWSVRLQLVRGYSRDHRPELNQVILSSSVKIRRPTNVYMQALSGNSNDTKAFAQTVRRHLSSPKAAQECRYLVGDAALTAPIPLQLLAQQQQLFVTGCPSLSMRQSRPWQPGQVHNR